jgi:cell shape-determining protein MreD
MISENLLTVLIFAALFLEISLIPFPAVFLASLIAYILYPSIRTIIITCAGGLLLDILNVSVLGVTPLAMLISYLLIELYKKFFELRSFKVLLAILFVSTYLFAWIFSYPHNLLVFIVIFTAAGLSINYFLHGRLWLKQVQK